MIQAEQLLSTVTILHTTNEDARARYVDRFAPDFNYCEFIDFDELKISSILAWMLNPKQTHGQRGLFLDLLIRRLQMDWTRSDCDQATVTVEAQAYAEKRRRIDIFVQSKDRVLGIENKLWGAGDQDDQVLHYLEHLDRVAPTDPNRCLIYLTTAGEEPTSKSIPPEEFRSRLEARQLHMWSFKNDLQNWLADCKAASKAQRISIFINELQEKLYKHIEGIEDMTENDQIVDLATRNPDTVRAAFAISHASEDIKAALTEKLHQAITDICARRGWALKWDLSQAWQTGLAIDFGPRITGSFCLQFERPYFQGLIFGAVSDSQNTEDRLRLTTGLQKSFGAARSDQNWLWYRNAASADPILPVETSWKTVPSPWIAIADGTLSKQIIEAAERFRKELEAAPPNL